MSEDNISLEFLAARVAALTGRMHDLELRFSALEARFGALEGRLDAIEIRLGALEKRFTVQEAWTSRILASLLRLASGKLAAGAMSEEAIPKWRHFTRYSSCGPAVAI